MYKNLLYFAIIIMGMVFLLNACGTIGGSSEVGLTFKQPTVTINKTSSKGDAANKKSDIVKELPASMWPEPVQQDRMIPWQAAITSGLTKKVPACLLQGDGVPIKVGTKVEVLQESECMYFRLQRPGNPPVVAPVGLLKIRVISTGEEGWTFRSSVDYDEE